VRTSRRAGMFRSASRKRLSRYCSVFVFFSGQSLDAAWPLLWRLPGQLAARSLLNEYILPATALCRWIGHPDNLSCCDVNQLMRMPLEHCARHFPDLFTLVPAAASVLDSLHIAVVAAWSVAYNFDVGLTANTVSRDASVAAAEAFLEAANGL